MSFVVTIFLLFNRWRNSTVGRFAICK